MTNLGEKNHRLIPSQDCIKHHIVDHHQILLSDPESLKKPELVKQVLRNSDQSNNSNALPHGQSFHIADTKHDHDQLIHIHDWLEACSHDENCAEHSDSIVVWN